MIRPLGDQLIIRLIEPGSVGSIILPDSAKGITLLGSGSPHEVEDATDYLINARLFEEVIQALNEDRRAANPARQQKWRQEVAAKLEKARSMPIPNNLSNAVHFVEAEVVAVGPGRSSNGDPTLIADLVRKLDQLAMHDQGAVEGTQALIDRAAKRNRLIPLSVRVGNRILFHPSVQRFDREIEPVLVGEIEGRFFIIREDSVLAILEEEQAA